ncbi:ligand-gated channel protein [Colwellia sp. 75C3]|uniref:TonB-dependent receptor domain-containing protein n=1 Tax=Colwellia sp. 75C3 TaxID=888425 RepID=UPI000C34501F|nr:TonB-dependent receptor [Colwellia sp. 75C3]PKG83801.1 ligand-gated channel protein [Colwellia sp. 75C3]
MLKTSLTLLALIISGQVHSQALQSDANKIQQQSKEQSKEKDIERIIVTGSRIAESIDEVPASITVITQKQIAAQLKVSSEIQSLLANLVPGMAPSTGTSSNSGQTLRGRSPLVMIDGVPQSTPLRNGALGIRTLDASVIERIEVIKGATSIYGNGAAGGIINYITKKANSDKALSGHASVSSRFSAIETEDSVGQRYEGGINGEVNNFNYVLNASYEKNGLQRDADGDILGLKYGLSDAVMQDYFAKVGYHFDDEKSLQFTYNYYQSKQDVDLIDQIGNINTGDKTQAIPVPEGKSVLGDPQGPTNQNIMLKYVDDEVFEQTQLMVDLYSQEVENIFFYSPTLANLDGGYTGGQSLINSEKTGLRVTLNTLVDFNFDNGGSLEATFIYGIDALNDVTSQPMVDGRIWVPEMDMKNLAGFLQTKLIYNDDLVIKLGVRQEDIDLTVNDYSTLKLCKKIDQCSVPVDVTGDTLNYKATTYNIGIKYNALPLFSPFVSYSQGADISDTGRLLRTASVTDISLIRTEASVIDNYELGFSSDFEQVHFEFATYFSTSELGTTNKFNEATGVYVPVRAPQEIYGYEALINYEINDAWAVNATYSWVEGKNTEADVYLGAKQISPPKATFNVNWTPNNDISVAINYLYVGDRKRFEAVDGEYVGDQGPIDSYQIVNLSGSYNFATDWSTFIGVENLFNQDYYPTKSQGYTYGGYNIKGLGTTVNLGVNYQF